MKALRFFYLVFIISSTSYGQGSDIKPGSIKIWQASPVISYYYPGGPPFSTTIGIENKMQNYTTDYNKTVIGIRNVVTLGPNSSGAYGIYNSITGSKVNAYQKNVGLRSEGLGGNSIGIQGHAYELSTDHNGNASYTGVDGFAIGDSGTFIGVYGKADKTTNTVNRSQSSYIGVCGRADGAFDAIHDFAIYGSVNEWYNPDNLPNNRYAGYFDGRVHINGTLSKSAGTFKIDHPLDPLNKYLSHSFVESPDMMNIYNGNITTDQNGKAIVLLPTYFESLNIDFRYQLTVIGAFSQAIIFEEIKENKFTIASDKPNIKVSWQVTGVRNDAYAKKNRVIPEQIKPKSEQGKYLNSEAFGLPKGQSINSIKVE